MKYYLINNEIKKATSEMPAPNTRAFYAICLNEWKHDLQPCSITESELKKVISEVYMLTGVGIPIDVTSVIYIDVVGCDNCFENEGGIFNPNCCQKIREIVKFKQPNIVTKSDETNEAAESQDNIMNDLLHEFKNSGLDYNEIVFVLCKQFTITRNI